VFREGPVVRDGAAGLSCVTLAPMKRDRIEEMGRTTFAGQLDLDGQPAAETTVRPQPVHKPVDTQKGSDRTPTDQSLPFDED